MDEKIKAAFDAAPSKIIKETFEYLESVKKEKTFKIVSSFPTINGLNITIKKGKRCYEFEAGNMNIVADTVNYQEDAYGYLKPFFLENDLEKIYIIEGAAKWSMSIGQTFKTTGTFNEIESNFIRNKKTYFRLIIPLKDNVSRLHYSYLKSETFTVGNSLRPAGLVKFEVDGKRFDLFDFKYTHEERYLFIDCMDLFTYEKFEKHIAAVIYAIGLIGGYTNRDEIYCIQSNNNTFTEPKGFHYRKIEDSIYSGMETVAPKILSQKGKKELVKMGYISQEVFSALVTKASKDKRLLRAIKIICEGNIYSLEIRASAYSVALETIKNIIIEENQEKINPFKDKNIAKQTIATITDLINKIDDDLFTNKQAVLNKIDQLNQVTNKDSFKISFKLYNIKLNKDDEKCIEKRNDFLHGRIPFEDELEVDSNKELQFITYKLHFLTTSLILKYCGFSGLVKNNPKFFSVLSSGKEINEPLFRYI